MAEHRVSVLSASLRHYEDPARSSDPRIRAIVAELRSVEPAPVMRAHFRAELRSQLVAVAPRLVAEGVGVERPLTHEPKKAAAAAPRELPVAGARLGRGGAFALARPAAIAATIVAVFAMILGGAVWMSRNAVPGDSLYGLKRANESVQLSLTSGDTARGKKYLEFASERTNEISTLLARSSALALGGGTSAGAGINSHTAKLVNSTLDAADNDVRNASRLLGNAAVESNSASPLTVMAKWAPEQVQRLQQISARVPSNSPLASRAAASTLLVSEAVSRSKTLGTMLDCHCLNNAPSDSLGPLPCIVCTPTDPPASSGNNGGTNGSTGSGPNPQVTTGAGSSSTDSGSSNGVQPPAGGSSTSGPGGLRLPSLTNGPTIQLPPIIPVPNPSGDPSAACVINLLGICVKI